MFLSFANGYYLSGYIALSHYGSSDFRKPYKVLLNWKIQNVSRFHRVLHMRSKHNCSYRFRLSPFQKVSSACISFIVPSIQYCLTKDREALKSVNIQILYYHQRRYNNFLAVSKNDVFNQDQETGRLAQNNEKFHFCIYFIANRSLGHITHYRQPLKSIAYRLVLLFDKFHSHIRSFSW